MHETSTPDNDTTYCKTEIEDNEIEMQPRQSTLNFLMQFARAYTCEPALGGNFGAYLAN